MAAQKQHKSPQSQPIPNSIEQLAQYLPMVEQSDPEMLRQPTLREEANALTAHCFRNTILEDVHAGDRKLDQATMKELMIQSSRNVETWLRIRNESQANPRVYYFWVNFILRTYASEWEGTRASAQ